MVELFVNGRATGVFSTEQKADEYVEKENIGTCQIFPFGTLLETDIEE